MTFIEEVIKDSMDVWEAYLEHPFIRGIQNGTLEEEKFKEYIIQDSIYLKEYARVFALGMYKAKTLKEMQLFYSLLNFVQANENTTRVQYLKQFNLDDELVEEILPKKENQAYIDFMLDIAKAENADIPEILMATLPCMLTYCYIFRKIVERGVNPETPYQNLIEDYISEGYLECCKEWSIYANTVCKDLGQQRKERLKQIFRTSSEYEMGFWDMANKS